MGRLRNTGERQSLPSCAVLLLTVCACLSAMQCQRRAQHACSRGLARGALLGAPPLLVLGAARGGQAADERRQQPGPARCKEGCIKYGNCGEDGFCRCPFGRLGEACEIDFLAPCKQASDGDAYCGTRATKSCECMRRCREYFCMGTGDAAGCDAWNTHPDRACYTRKGVPPEQQFSRIPEENEQVVFTRWLNDTLELDRPTALKDPGAEEASVPLSKCPEQCSQRGYCFASLKDAAAKPYCRCHRSYGGPTCKEENPQCFLNCSGKGKCRDGFCHCEPPHFSIGCSRSTVYPANHSRPSPVDLKIYMYELQTQDAFEFERWVGRQHRDSIYVGYQHFMEQFLRSPARTEDPSEAHLFFIPTFTFAYSSNTGNPSDHLNLVLNKIRMAHPYWNRTGGRDHFIWVPQDQGACVLRGISQDLIHIQHFAMHSTMDNKAQYFAGAGHPDYGCHHPLRDVVVPPHDGRNEAWLAATLKLSLEEVLARKKRMLFFAGGTRDDLAYSGGTRQALAKLVQEWNDPDFQFVRGAEDYEGSLRESKFCLAPYGFGWGNRLMHAMLTACVPVIVQEHNFHPFEELLPYEAFSVRLNNADLPRLRETLRAVTDEQYKVMLQSLLRFSAAFSWHTDSGGRAFEYTLASLRRRHLNLKAMYY